MAQHMLTPPEMSFADKRRNSSTANAATTVTTIANFASNASMDSVLMTSHGYTQKQVDTMTQNDKVYALRLLTDSTGV